MVNVKRFSGMDVNNKVQKDVSTTGSGSQCDYDDFGAALTEFKSWCQTRQRVRSIVASKLQDDEKYTEGQSKKNLEVEKENLDHCEKFEAFFERNKKVIYDNLENVKTSTLLVKELRDYLNSAEEDISRLKEKHDRESNKLKNAENAMNRTSVELEKVHQECWKDNSKTLRSTSTSTPFHRNSEHRRSLKSSKLLTKTNQVEETHKINVDIANEQYKNVAHAKVEIAAKLIGHMTKVEKLYDNLFKNMLKYQEAHFKSRENVEDATCTSNKKEPRSDELSLFQRLQAFTKLPDSILCNRYEYANENSLKRITYTSPLNDKKKKRTQSLNVDCLLIDYEPTIRYVKILFDHIEGHGLETKGLYRQSGSEVKCKELLEKLRDHYDDWDEIVSPDDQKYGIHTVANCAKKLLLENESLKITTDVKENILKVFNKMPENFSTDSVPEHVLEELIPILKKLPSNSEILIMTLLRHLNKVAESSNTNCMTLANLAMTFTPALINNYQVDTTKWIKIVDVLIRNWEHLFRMSNSANRDASTPSADNCIFTICEDSLSKGSDKKSDGDIEASSQFGGILRKKS